MLNRQVAINTVPYFWTVLLGKSIRFTGDHSKIHFSSLWQYVSTRTDYYTFLLILQGYGEGYTDIVFKGSLEERTFLAFYIK